MSQTLLRGLKLLETVDFYGPLSISALARHLDVDKATASRMVASCEPDGWLVRDGDGVRIGATGRPARPGRPLPVRLCVRPSRLVHAVCGVTGASRQAVGLVGTSRRRPGLGLAMHGAASGYGLTTTLPALDQRRGQGRSRPSWSAAQLDELLPDPFPAREHGRELSLRRAVLEAFAASIGPHRRGSRDGAANRPWRTDRASLITARGDPPGRRLLRPRRAARPDRPASAVPWPVRGMPAA